MFMRDLGGGLGHKSTQDAAQTDDAIKHTSEREQNEQEERLDPAATAQVPFMPLDPNPSLSKADDSDDQPGRGCIPRPWVHPPTVGASSDRGCIPADQLDRGCIPRRTDHRWLGSSPASNTSAPDGKEERFDEVADDDEDSDWCGLEGGEHGSKPASEADAEDNGV